jgi:DNA-binding LacI/PurR family transcriptional regulator
MDNPGLAAVVSDTRAGGARGGRALLAGGHRRIAHVAGWQGTSTGRDRSAGFAQALAAVGQAPIWIEDGRYNREEAARIVRARCADPAERPDAIFVGNDHMAFAVMDVLRHELGLDVPGEVSVIGFDDVSVAAWPVYDLTTLRQPIARMVAAVVAALLGRIEDGAAPERVVLETQFKRRSSARLPQGWGEAQNDR